MLKALQEMPQPCGLVFSGTVLLIPKEAGSDGCLYSENRKALSLPRSLLNAASFPHGGKRSDTGPPSVSARLCFTGVVKSVQGAGVRVMRGRRREIVLEEVRGQTLMLDAGWPQAVVWRGSPGVTKKGDDGAGESYYCCLMCMLARWYIDAICECIEEWELQPTGLLITLQTCFWERGSSWELLVPLRKQEHIGTLTLVDYGKCRHGCL